MANKPELKKLAWPAYFTGVIMIVLTGVDLVSNMFPVRVEDPAWRYGVIGLGSGFLMTPLLGMLVIIFVAVWTGQSRVNRALGWLNLAIGAVLLPVMGMFVLDAVQIRNSVQPDAIRTFDVGVLKALIKIGLVSVAFGWLGWRGIRVRDRRRADDGPGLVRQPS